MTRAVPRPPWDDYFMRYAYLAATRATCPRRHVGAVIVDPDHRVVATGYNGSPPGVISCDDAPEGCQIVNGHCVRTLHAESNALDYAGTRLAHNGTLYTTVTPCWDCAKRIVGAKIMRVVYDEHYESRYGKSTDVPDYLRAAGVEVERFAPERMSQFKELLKALDVLARAFSEPLISPEKCAVHRFQNDVCVICGIDDRDG